MVGVGGGFSDGLRLVLGLSGVGFGADHRLRVIQLSSCFFFFFFLFFFLGKGLSCKKRLPKTNSCSKSILWRAHLFLACRCFHSFTRV